MKDNNSVITALNNVHAALLNLYDRFDNNSENVDLNELDSVTKYPFRVSLDIIINDLGNYIEAVESDIKKC